jgi:hypothetical protein
LHIIDYLSFKIKKEIKKMLTHSDGRILINSIGSVKNIRDYYRVQMGKIKEDFDDELEAKDRLFDLNCKSRFPNIASPIKNYYIMTIQDGDNILVSKESLELLKTKRVWFKRYKSVVCRQTNGRKHLDETLTGKRCSFRNMDCNDFRLDNLVPITEKEKEIIIFNEDVNENPLLEHVKDNGLYIDTKEWSELKETYSRDKLCIYIAQLKVLKYIDIPARPIKLHEAKKDYSNLVDSLPIYEQNKPFRIKYDVPLENPLGIFPIGGPGNKSSGYFHNHLRQRTSYRNSKSFYESWNSITIENHSILTSIWTLKIQKITPGTMFGAISMRAYVPVQFRPITAKSFYSIYSPLEGDVHILDPCGGWGDRLSGALAFERTTSITIIEPRLEAREEYYKQHLHYNSTKFFRVFSEGLEDAMPKLPNDYFDIIMTSPPYFNNEKYGDCSEDCSTQSYIKCSNYDEWRDNFLAILIEESYRLLKDGGYFGLNINNVKDGNEKILPLCQDSISIAEEVGFTYVGVWGYCLNNTSKKDIFSEPLYVWKK